MSVYSLNGYYFSSKRIQTSQKNCTHQKASSYLDKPTVSSNTSAFTNLRNKLNSLDLTHLTHSRKNYFYEFFKDFKQKSLNNSHLAIQQTIVKPKSLGKNLIKTNFSSSSSSNSSSSPSGNKQISTIKQKLEEEMKKIAAKSHFSTIKKNYKALKNNENEEFFHNEKKEENFIKKTQIKLNSRLLHKNNGRSSIDTNNEIFKEKNSEIKLGASNGININTIYEQIKSKNFKNDIRTKIQELLENIDEIKPRIKFYLQGLQTKKNDIEKFYDKQLTKIQSFYDSFIQSLEAEKLSIMTSFLNHKERAIEIYQNFQKELSNNESDIKDLEMRVLSPNLKTNIQEISLLTQEKIMSAKLNLNSLNQEFLSVYRTTGLNENRLESLKSKFFPFFEMVQIPTSLVKKHLKLEKKIKSETTQKNKKNEDKSMKFKNILEKIKKNQAKNSELYKNDFNKDKTNEKMVKSLNRAKSFPSFHHTPQEYSSDGPFLSFIEKQLNESQEISALSTHPTYQKTLFVSPSFKEN